MMHLKTNKIKSRIVHFVSYISSDNWLFPDNFMENVLDLWINDPKVPVAQKFTLLSASIPECILYLAFSVKQLSAQREEMFSPEEDT